MITIAVLGLGYMGQSHARIFSSFANVDLVAVCDQDMSKAKKVANQYKINSYTDYKKLIKEEKLNAISICLPTSLHFEAGMYAAKMGMALFIEKPICATVKEAKKLAQFTSRKKIPIMIGHIERFNPVVNEIKQRITAGELGKIFQIHTQRFSPPPTRAKDVSAIVDLATHDADIISYLLNLKPIRIFSESDNRAHKKDDLSSTLLRYKNGIIALLEVSWVHPTKIRVIRVLGEQGMYMADYITQELYYYKQNDNIFKNNVFPSNTSTKADVVKIAFESKEPLFIELKSFISALENKKQMPVTEREGLNALQIVEKITQSSLKNKIIV